MIVHIELFIYAENLLRKGECCVYVLLKCMYNNINFMKVIPMSGLKICLLMFHR